MLLSLDRKNHGAGQPSARRGYVAALVAIFLVTICGFVAFGVDMGLVFAAKGELQRTADAAALAAALELINEDRLRGDTYQEAVFVAARNSAASMAAQNPVRGSAPIVVPGEDVTVGILAASDEIQNYGSPAEADLVNAVEVTVRRDEERGGPINLFFGSLLGMESKSIQVEAAAAFDDNVVGFEVTDPEQHAMLLPFALQVDYWNMLLAGTYSNGDNYSYNSATHSVGPGSDGILEINLYPGGGSGQLPPGNFGTIDIGPPNNSTADLERQILEGVNQDDLSYFGGSLQLNASGEIPMSGDTGLSAGLKEELAEVKDKADCRILPLFSTVSGNGENAMFTIVGFAGIRICHVKLVGSMGGKKLIIQPSFCMDASALPGSGGVGQFVYTPPRLVR
jgi:hypothetical protein